MCWLDTQTICEKLDNPDQSIKIKYCEDVHKNIILNREGRSTESSRNTSPDVPPFRRSVGECVSFKKKHNKSNIYIHDMDTIDCALTFNNPLVLNLADNYFPGGYVGEGAGAQEESLFRRTNYFQTLLKTFYPIEKDEAIYSSNVSIVKQSEKNNWDLYEGKSKKLDFIACPGIKYPGTILKDNTEQLNNVDVERLKIKIKTIIQCALKYKHDVIIFGALGCGAWRNPPHHVAKIFKEILQEYDGVISTYVFAILTTGTANTVDIFRETFGYY